MIKSQKSTSGNSNIREGTSPGVHPTFLKSAFSRQHGSSSQLVWLIEFVSCVGDVVGVTMAKNACVQHSFEIVHVCCVRFCVFLLYLPNTVDGRF